MPTISVRISEEEKRRLLKYGRLSSSVRYALNMYLNKKESEKLLQRLEELQRKNHVRTTSIEENKLIKEDRNR
jgi:uncharacterized protein YlbG (UPF0298 family)